MNLRKNIFYHEVSTSDYPLFKYTPYEQVLTSKLVDVVKFEKLDLLHVHYAIPHASAAYMAQQILSDQNIKIPFITTLHGTDITLVGKDPSFEPVINFSINKSNMVTAVSESLKKDTKELFEVKKILRLFLILFALMIINLKITISTKKDLLQIMKKLFVIFQILEK